MYTTPWKESDVCNLKLSKSCLIDMTVNYVNCTYTE